MQYLIVESYSNLGEYKELTIKRTRVLKDSRPFTQAIGPRLGAVVAFIAIVFLSVGLGWSIWAAVRSLASALLKSAG